MITSQQSFTHASLPGVKVYPISGDLKRGFQQQVLVCVEPETVVPLHSHDVDATMDIVAGNAMVLSYEPRDNWKKVETGARVFFEKGVMHGFRSGAEGLRFLSTNDGIVDEHGEWDIRNLTEEERITRTMAMVLSDPR